MYFTFPKFEIRRSSIVLHHPFSPTRACRCKSCIWWRTGGSPFPPQSSSIPSSHILRFVTPFHQSASSCVLKTRCIVVGFFFTGPFLKLLFSLFIKKEIGRVKRMKEVGGCDCVDTRVLICWLELSFILNMSFLSSIHCYKETLHLVLLCNL